MYNRPGWKLKEGAVLPIDLPSGTPVDGPRNVLLDMGANCGNSYYKMMEPHPWLKRNVTDAFLFEWNPMIIKHHLHRLASLDSRVTVVPHPVFGEDMSNFSMFMDSRGDPETDEEWTSVFPFPCSKKVWKLNSPSPASTYNKNYSRAGTEFPGLTAVGFLPWFRRQKFPESAEIVVKVDVEGAECTVLDTWMDAGMTCRVSQYFVEWHARFDTASAETGKPPCQIGTKARLIREVRGCRKKGFKTTYQKWE